MIAKRRLIGLIALIALLLPTLSPAAQGIQTPKKPPLPLFLGLNNGADNNEGDLYSWDGGLRRKTTWTHNYAPIASPDGNNVAYTSSPEFWVKTLSPDRYGQLPQPLNIWIMNTTTGKAIKIADQPASASVAVDSAAFILRSSPTWSPTGRQLAWTEIAIDQAAKVNTDYVTERLVIYDLDTGITRTIVEQLPDHRFTDIFPILSQAAWGYPGIAVLTHAKDPSRFPEMVTVYTPDGIQMSQSEPMNDTGFNYSQLIWIEDENYDYVTSISGDVILDPYTGKPITVNGTPELFSPLNPNGISLFYGDKTAGEGNPVWLIAMNGQVKDEMAAAGRYYYTSGIALSSDGTRAAYIVYPGQGTQGGLYIFRNGVKTRLNLSGVTGVAWGPTAWRLRRDNAFVPQG